MAMILDTPNKGRIRKKMIWLRKIIKPIVSNRCNILLRVDKFYGSRFSLKPLDNLT